MLEPTSRQDDASSRLAAVHSCRVRGASLPPSLLPGPSMPAPVQSNHHRYPEDFVLPVGTKVGPTRSRSGSHVAAAAGGGASASSADVDSEVASPYPNVKVDIPWGMPVEVTVVAVLPPGTGDALLEHSLKKQEAHANYVDEFNEPSARIYDTLFPQEVSAVYTFGVCKLPLVFHRHEGHRCITGITGSAGADMRFSGATAEEAHRDPKLFIDQLFVIHVPPDVMFTLRFNGMVYHQFAPVESTRHAFFAVSVHTNEAGGNLDPETLALVLANKANIPLLTEPIPPAVAEALLDADVWQTARKYRLERF